MGEVGCLKDGNFQNLKVAGNTIINKFHNKNIVEQSGTDAEDLSATTSNLVWYSNEQQAGNITLPQATAQNAGMTIKIIVAGDGIGDVGWSDTAFQLGCKSSGSTVLTGYLTLGSTIGTAHIDAIKVTGKSLVLDRGEASKAGGAIGSTYLFTYLEANLIHVEASGMGSHLTEAPALDTNACGPGTT